MEQDMSSCITHTLQTLSHTDSPPDEHSLAIPRSQTCQRNLAVLRSLPHHRFSCLNEGIGDEPALKEVTVPV